MLPLKIFRIVLAGVMCLAFPLNVFAQGSPDIIWKRQVNSDRLNSVIFSPKGDTLISGGSDRTINLWRVSDGALLQTLNTNAPFVHASAIESLSITSDGSLLASCSYKLIQLWKLPSGAMQRLNGHTDWVVGVAFSPDGSLLASASFDTTVRIWRASDGALLHTIPGTAQQRCVAFSPDGSLLAIGSGAKSVRLFRTSDWTLVQTLVGHTEDIFVVAFSPDGSSIASGGYDDTVKLWNVADGTLKFTFSGNGGNVYGLAYTPDGSKLAYTDGEGNTIKIYRTADGVLSRTFTTEVDAVQTVAFSPTGLLGYGRIDETVVLARINTSASARVSSPAPGTSFNSPANISIVASPSKAASNIATMEFFQNGVKLGEDSTSPFSFNWSGVPPGVYSLSVVETDKQGATTTSLAVTVTVIDPNNQLPSISLTGPVGGANFTAPADISITANVSAAAGVANVEFFEDGISLGQDLNMPFSIVWSSVPSGNYSLTAIVTDKNGAKATASPVDIAVGTGGQDSVKPRVAITTPVAGARLKTGDVHLNGTASDNAAVAQVLYSLNSTSFRTAEGTTTWEASVALLPGENIVQVKSVDSAGNESDIVSRTFTYIASSQIALSIDGSGKISGLKNGQALEIGKVYSIRAIAKKDWVFNGWTGSLSTNSATLTFTMISGTSLTANFIQSPFAAARGIYTGLIDSTLPRHDRIGLLRIVTTRSGGFSGKFLMGGVTYALRGQFKGDGTYAATYSTRNLTFQMQLHLEDNTNQITGSLSDGSFTSTFVANQSVYNSKANPAPQSGRYTILIPPNAARPTSPQGNGFALLKVDAAGNARVSGSLADGSKFTQSAPVSKLSTWPFYVSIYQGGGSISGIVTFRDQPIVSDLDGAVNWFRPAAPGSKIFGNGFTTRTVLLGSVFSVSGNGPVLNVPSHEANVLVNLANGDLDGELQETATLEPNNQFVVTPANTAKIRLSISRSSGALKGSFLHPATGRNTSHRGVVFQKQNLAQGYFLGPEQSGMVSVVPIDEPPQLNIPEALSVAPEPASNNTPAQ